METSGNTGYRLKILGGLLLRLEPLPPNVSLKEYNYVSIYFLLLLLNCIFELLIKLRNSLFEAQMYMGITSWNQKREENRVIFKFCNKKINYHSTHMKLA